MTRNNRKGESINVDVSRVLLAAPLGLRMTKTELLSALENVMRNFVFGHVLVRVAHDADISGLEHEIICFESSRSHAEVALDAIFKGASSLKAVPRLVTEFQASLSRAAIAEYFECIKSYCKLIGQEAALKGASWYGFVRIIRNTTSHSRGGHILWPPEFKENGIKSVTWQHLSIDESMEGKELTLFGSDIILLLSDLRAYAETHLG